MINYTKHGFCLLIHQYQAPTTFRLHHIAFRLIMCLCSRITVSCMADDYTTLYLVSIYACGPFY